MNKLNNSFFQGASYIKKEILLGTTIIKNASIMYMRSNILLLFNHYSSLVKILTKIDLVVTLINVTQICSIICLIRRHDFFS